MVRLLLLLAALAVTPPAIAEEIALVRDGEPVLVTIVGESPSSDGALSPAPGTLVESIPRLVGDEATIRARVRFHGDDALVYLGRSRLLFDERVRLERPLETESGKRWSGEGEWIDLRIELRDRRLRVFIDDESFLEIDRRAPLRRVAFEGPLDLSRWSVEGDVEWPVTEVEDPAPFDMVVFADGDLATTVCRIPALAVANDGTLLAFCEGRRSSAADDADTDILLRRSTDGGESWSAGSVVVSDDADSAVTLGNPTVVVDRASGAIVLLYCRDNRRVFRTRSLDHGVSWEQPEEITRRASQANWVWYGTGPGSGIQSSDGRLLVPASHQDGGGEADLEGYRRRTHLIASDDGGSSWSIIGIGAGWSSEAAVVERSDGSLFLNSRNHLAVKRRRLMVSRDGGYEWEKVDGDYEMLTDPECHASMIALPSADDVSRETILFANLDSARERKRLTVRASEDGGRTWPVRKLMRAGTAGYTSMAALADGSIGLLYEAGTTNLPSEIRFARFTVEWLQTPFAERRTRLPR